MRDTLFASHGEHLAKGSDRMATRDARPIVVGVDGSESALDAAAWAASEAALHDVPLRIVHGVAESVLRVPTGLWGTGTEDGLRIHADLLVREAAATAHAAAPGVDVSTAVERDLPLPLLVGESHDALYVVVAAADRNAVADMVAGSTAVSLVARAHAPVAVVRSIDDPERDDRLVIVGVDGSPLADAAIQVGIQEAMLRHGRLLAVHVVHHYRGRGTQPATSDTSDGTALLTDALRGWRHKFPELQIEDQVMAGHPAGVLVRLSNRAGLIVVGARGLGGFTGMLIGSVSQALLHHAHCPLMTVPPATRQRVQQRDDLSRTR
ncbi:universal stress protein [Actinopolymorpha cephalotaxi]|uniref:Nucleotide-binding universal stress UspA family protein n=2 Tax=Actinopolymorpha cephalotaxi TaxID=504797 RepID=A0ABX2S3A1_9ACTN|nr:universal stress protein [Actinopolymorpha cephalotaxi]NYH84069.1 nucleotide-binding universal stress UspA family protein [Actinopolymorpha cephalotaxi]